MSATDWTRRLSDVFGAPLDAITVEHIDRVVAANVSEDDDLDFKEALYGNGEGEKRELAGDVAAMWNDQGGVILLGVSDDYGAAAGAPEVDLSEGEAMRMQQIVVSNTAPYGDVTIRRIPGRADGRGFYLLIAPPSPYRPHAVRVNNDLRYPRRYGPMTRYLSELEVADLYRSRFRGEREQIDRLRQIGDEPLLNIDTSDMPWVVAAAVPNTSGSLQISGEGRTAIQQWCSQDFGDGFPDSQMFGDAPVAGVGVRRYTVGAMHDRGLPSPISVYAECHTDGSAAAALSLRQPHPEPAPGRTVIAHWLLKHTVSLLSFVGRHAQGNARAHGDAALALRIVGPEMHFGWLGGFGTAERYPNTRSITGEASSVNTVPLDSLTGEASHLLAASAIALTDIYNAFGRSEVTFVTTDGALRRPYFSEAKLAWAAEHGVEIVEGEAPD
jgi:hypothetical protein